MGGTSYGIYQFSSRQGTMTSFIEYLKQEAPDMASKLEQGGRSNTGSRYGKMPEIWQRIAQDDEKRFTELQHKFAVEYYYTPIAEDFRDKLPKHRAVKELLFSTAIQHGVHGAKNIVQRALEGKHRSPAHFIRAVYNLRKTQFNSSPSETRMAVQNRLTAEMNTILALYGA